MKTALGVALLLAAAGLAAKAYLRLRERAGRRGADPPPGRRARRACLRPVPTTADRLSAAWWSG